MSLVECVRRDPRGNLAGLRPTHPVRDDVDRRTRVVGVLVRMPLAPGVGARGFLDDSQHRQLALARRSRRSLLVPELGVADPDPVIGVQLFLAAHAAAVQIGAVGRAHVLEVDPPIVIEDPGVLPRGEVVLDLDLDAAEPGRS